MVEKRPLSTSANFIGIIEAAETNNNVENVEYHVIGTLFNEEYTLGTNMLIYPPSPQICKKIMDLQENLIQEPIGLH